MNKTFKTKAAAIAAGYRPVNRSTDKDMSGPGSFGYVFESPTGEQTITVHLTEARNSIGNDMGAFVPMYPPKG